MPLTNVTTTFNLSDCIGADYDPRRTKVYLTTNAEKNRISDKSTGEIRLGGGTVTLAADGAVSATTWAPGPDANPASWQTTFHIDYVDAGTRQRQTVAIGPFTITTSGLLTALDVEQTVPATYLTEVTQQLDTKVAAAEAARDEAVNISGISTSDDVVETLIKPGAAGPKTKAALSASIADAPADVVARTGRFDRRTSTYRASGADLRRIRAKLAAVQAGMPNTVAKIALQGHSEIAGFGASVGLNSPSVLLAKMLAAGGYAVGTGWVPVFTNIGSGATRDGRWSYVLGAGAWEYTGSAAGGGNMHFHLRSITSGIKAVFASDAAGTVAQIVTTGNSAAFEYSIDGSAFTAYTPSGSSVVEAITVTGLADTTHTIVVRTLSTSATYLLGASVRPATAVEVSAFGLSGSRASDHLPGQLFYNPFQAVDTYDPDLVVVQLDVNEAVNGVSAATLATNLASIVAGHQADGRDIILVTSIRPSAVAAATWTPYREAVYELADSAAVPLVDIDDRLGSYTVANSHGLMYDATHPNAAGYADSMQALYAALVDGAVSATPPVTSPTVHAADNFARPDAASAGSTEIGSRAWAATGTGTLSITSNRLVLTTAGAAESDAYVNDGKADGTVQITLTSMTTSSGLIFRSSGTTDGYVFWRNGSTGAIKLSERTGVATYTDISGTAITDIGAIGDVMKVVLNGSSVKCYVNGKLVYTHTDATNASKTRHGMWKANVAAGVSADSFSHTSAA